MKPSEPKQFEEIYERMKVNKSWYNKSYSGYPIGIYQQGLIITREGIKNPYALNSGVLFLNYKIKDHFDWFWDVDHMKEKREIILSKVREDSNFAEEVLTLGEINHKKFTIYNTEISDLDLASASNDTLKQTFEKLHNLLIDVSVWSYAVDAFLSDGEVDWLELAIKDELKERATPEVIEVLTAPTFSSFVNDAEILFYQIANELKNTNTEKALQLAQEYETKYYWIRTNYKEYARVKGKQILQEASDWLVKNSDKNITELIEHDRHRIGDNIEKKTKVFSSLNVSKNLQSVLRFSEVFTHLQDNRKERVLRMNTLFFEFLAETQKRFSIPDPLAFYMTKEEIFGYYDGKNVDISEIQTRYDKGFLYVFCNDTAYLISAEKFKKDGVDKNFFKTHDNITEFKGTTAFRGKVTGRAHVLRSVQEIATFNDGEILIANQTTPEYVPAMKKAVAIVTDQGGITCHAAIVARELKIPAVIGTKIATQVLKDGDMVEVDADKGIVRIIK